MNIRSIFAAAILVSFPAVALAQSASDVRQERIDQRQANQQERINQGAQSGQLNQAEAARLERGQAHVQRMEDRAAADGKITGHEARRIERTQDRQSARIYRQKHDKQTAHK